MQPVFHRLRANHDFVGLRRVEHATVDDYRVIHVAKPHAVRGNEEHRLVIEAGHAAEGEHPTRDLRDLGLASERTPVGLVHADLAGENDRVGRIRPSSQPREGGIGATGARQCCDRETDSQPDE